MAQPATQLTNQPVSQETRKLETHESNRTASPSGRKPGSQEFRLAEEPYIKNTFLLTQREHDALEDLKLTLRRKHGLRRTKNDLIRCALHHLLEDFQLNGLKSPLYARLKEPGEW